MNFETVLITSTRLGSPGTSAQRHHDTVPAIGAVPQGLENGRLQAKPLVVR